MKERSARLLAILIGLAISAGVLVLCAYTGVLAFDRLKSPPIEAPDPDSLPITQQLAAQEVDLLVAVFRYQIEHSTSGIPRAGSTESVYISLDDRKDPPSEVLARFKSHVPSVEPVSAAGDMKAMPDVGGRIIFGATHIKWIDKDTAEIEGDYSCGALCGTGTLYRVQRKAGSWMVVSETVLWIA